MNCPVCKHKDVRRSRRHSAVDYALSLLGIYPWRCFECEARFYSRPMPLGESLRAHCPRCGNPDLKRISSEYVASPFSFLWRFLRIPAFRCEPCRHKYFSIRPYRSRPRELGQLSSAD
jgi:C4-type Zn-finger protein